MTRTNENDGASGTAKSASGSTVKTLQVVKNNKGKRPDIKDAPQNQACRLKRQRKVVDENENDDDFEVQPGQGGAAIDLEENESTKIKKESIKDIKARFRTIRTRSSPNMIVKALSVMTAAQKKEIHKMGFGALFDLQVCEIPGRLGFWVVDNFNPKTCSLVLHNGSELRVTEEDVARVLGFPIGGRKIVTKKKNEECAFRYILEALII